MCNVKEVAKYIITYCYKSGNPINNLALQYHLYLLWVYCYTEYKVILFNDLFRCRTFGVAVQDVYNEYCAYGGLKITKDYSDSIKLTSSAIEMITNYLNTHMNDSLFDMQSVILDKSNPWYSVYNDGEGKYKAIPFNVMVKSCVKNKEKI